MNNNLLPAALAVLTALFPVLGSTPLSAQSNQATDDRFCKQYASSTADVAQTAIDQNPSCLDFGRGVHGVYAMHYNWCLQNTRDTVFGAADHIRNLAAECTRNTTQPAPPQTQYGPNATLFSQQNGWTITQLSENGKVVACEAMRITGSEEGLFFRYDWDKTVIGFSSYSSAASPFPVDVDMWFDRKAKEYNTYRMDPVTDHNGFTWRALLMPNNEPYGEIDAFANLNSIHFGYQTGMGVQQAAFALTGTNRVVKDTIGCVQNAGTAAPQPTAPVDAAKVIYGSCKLIVDGMTYINMNGGCPIWLANDGTGTFWINADRSTYLGEYFASISPSGNGFAAGHWNGQSGSTHAQAFLGEDFQLKSGGCWVGQRATICATR